LNVGLLGKVSVCLKQLTQKQLTSLQLDLRQALTDKPKKPKNAPLIVIQKPES